MSTQLKAAQFIEAMRQLKKETGIEMRSVMRWQMGLWVQDIIKKIYGDPRASLAQQKQMGEKAVYSDLLGSWRHQDALFAGYDPAFGKPRDMKTTAGVVYDAVMLRSREGAPYLIDKAHFLPDASASQLAAIHRANRRNGRVQISGVRSRMAGTWRVSHTYTVPKDVLMAYVKSVQARVGRAKASWLKAFNYFKHSAGGNLLPWAPLPWIQRHAADMDSQGVVGDVFNEQAMKGEWAAGSNALYGIDPQQVIARTWPTRLKDLQGPYALKRLKGRMEKFSARKAA